MSGARQLFAWVRSSPGLSSLCATHPPLQNCTCEHCTSTIYWLQSLHLPPIVGWEETTAWSRCSQTSVVWNVIATYSCQADSCWNLVWNIFSVDMTNSRARDVLHATSTHPYLCNSRDTGSLLVMWRKTKKKKKKDFQVMKKFKPDLLL